MTHVKSYLGQARVAVHSAVRQLELARDALQQDGSAKDWIVLPDIESMIEQLTPIRDEITHAHRLVVSVQ